MNIKRWSILLCVMLITACGGGGGDSSTGAGTTIGSPNRSEISGTYRGVLTTTVTFNGETSVDREGFRMDIFQNGQVGIRYDQPGSNTFQCVNQFGAIFVTDNVVPYNDVRSCTSPEFGTCEIDTRGSLTIEGSFGRGRSQGFIDCSNVGRATILYEAVVERII